MKLRLIYNPRSGRPRRNAPVLPALKAFVASGSQKADLVCTEGPGHATEIARDAVELGYDRVVAVGGDGTVNEVAQALIDTPASMGLVPCGSGNGLALHLDLPRTLQGALELATSRSARVAELDTGMVNGLPFVNAMGLGLDADVARRFNGLTRRGLPAYARTAIAAFLGRTTERCRVAVGTENETFDALLIAVANSDQYGNNAKIAPHARVDDGLLDLVAVYPVGLVAALFLGARMFLGSIDGSSKVRRLRGARFSIEREAPGVIHTDGETHTTGATIEVVIRPKSLRLVVPSDCAALSPTGVRAASAFALQLP